MPTYGRAGVYTTEQLIGPQPTPQVLGSPSVAAFMGEWWRGPTLSASGTSGVPSGVPPAVLCRSWADFVTYFGGFNKSATPVLANPYLGFAVYEFFANGGQNCYVARVINQAVAGTPGTSALATFLDSQATPVGTFALQVGALGKAGNVGTWGNNVYAQVTNRGGVGSGRFNLSIFYGGNSLQNVVEQWVDLSMNASDSRYAPTIINSTVAGSLWVVMTDLLDPAASPNNCPASVGPVALSGGTDSADPTSADFVTALTFGSSPATAPFDTVQGFINMNLPGHPLSGSTTVVNAAIAYAQARPWTFLVLDTQSGLTPAQAVSYEQSLSPVSSYAGVYYPWVKAQDPSSQNLQATKLLPPGGFILGQYAATDTARGVWKAPAGISTNLQNVVAAERLFAPSDLDALNENNVNALLTQPNGQVVIWGTRTLNSAYASLYVPVRRTLLYIEANLAQLLNFAVFEPNDALLWGTISSICNQFLDGMYGDNAFAGNTAAQAFFVTCDNTNNTQQTISQGIVNTLVGVALLYPAEFIAITISQYQSTGQTVTSIAA